MNGLDLITCKLGNWDKQFSIQFDGSWGNWGKIKMCPKSYYIYAARGQFEKIERIGQDNTALNGVAFKCKSHYSDDTKELTFEGLWG